MPDSLPVTSHVPRVIYAFGHGHLGLTLAAAMARLVTEIMPNRASALDLTHYRPDRF